MSRDLHSLLDECAKLHATRPAVGTAGQPALNYAELVELSDRLRDRLVTLGVRPGDRVGVCMPKSVDAVATLFGILKCGAAYVPVDPEAPPARCAYILADCSVSAVVTARRLESQLCAALAEHGINPSMVVLDYDHGQNPLEQALRSLDETDTAEPAETHRSTPDDLAYILYTSGSTGRPKGVMLSHRAARTFVDWCGTTFDPRPEDVYSSHAPLHFDLSIHDIFVPLAHGARLVLIGEQLGKDPINLAPAIADEGITVWYSTPSILNLLAQHGRLERHSWDALRLVLFAGEVFPIPQLRAIKQRWPGPRYFNLYGPTETNVCTYFEVPREVEDARVDPYPIGRMCPPLRGRVVNPVGVDVAPGEEGELIVSGPGVMTGYWNLPEQNARAFLVDEAGGRWYRTGDVVVDGGGGEYVFHGRRDRMVKRRGYRVELGEIEAGLARHPGVTEVAVVALTDEEAGVRIKAYLGVRDGTPLSVIALKQFSAEHLPRYMVPDAFSFVEALPRTSTDKIDYQSLLSQG